MSNRKKLVIVGGVAGGASAAARARRLDDRCRIIVLERGPHVSFANCGLPYHLGGEIGTRDALLLHTPASLQARFGLEVRVRHEVRGIDRARQIIHVRDLESDRDYEESYDGLLLAPGAAPIRPPLPGIDDPRVFTLRTLPDLDRLLAALGPDARHVTVVGAGFIGLETVEALRHRALEVALIERGGQLLAPLDADMASLLYDEVRQNGVDVHVSCGLQGIVPGPRLRLDLGPAGELTTDRVILAIGVRPETTLAQQAGLELGPRGGIRVDAQQRTSDPAICAVGDAVEVVHVVSGQPVLLPLAGPANRQGRIAAATLLGRSDAEAHYRGSQGTAICKVFGLAAAATGLNEKALLAAGVSWQSVHVHGNDHASYYPGATQVHLKLLFDPASGRILGAQAVGANGVDKRIDVIATAMQGGLTVEDLAEAELCYAPPYGSARDPVNVLGMAATNVRQGLVRLLDPGVLDALPGLQVLDVREPDEVAGGMLPGALHVPLSRLRTSHLPVDRERPVLVYCAIGLRGYIAYRHLQQSGYDVYSLNGGYRSWQMALKARQLAEAVPVPQDTVSA